MHNQHVRRVRQELSLRDVDLLVAAIALIVLNGLTFDHLAKTVVYASAILDLQRQVVEHFKLILDLAARLANQLRALIALKDIFEEISLAGGLQQGLESVEEEVEKLLGVLLLADLGWCAINVLESKAQLLWVICMSF